MKAIFWRSSSPPTLGGQGALLIGSLLFASLTTFNSELIPYGIIIHAKLSKTTKAKYLSQRLLTPFHPSFLPSFLLWASSKLFIRKSLASTIMAAIEIETCLSWWSTGFQSSLIEDRLPLTKVLFHPLRHLQYQLDKEPAQKDTHTHHSQNAISYGSN